MNHADELLARYVLEVYRDEKPHSHLGTCPEATVSHVDGQDGTWGCETGCEHLTLEATITCPHGESEEYEYGEFGGIAAIIEDMERQARRADPSRLEGGL